MNTHAHPWKLRLVHHGFSHVDLAWEGGQIHFNPLRPVDTGDVVILLSTWPEAMQGIQIMLNNRQWCTVIAPTSVVEWLGSRGWPNDQLHTALDKDDLSVELEEYSPIPTLTPKEAVYKGWETLKRPWRTIGRVKAHRATPDCNPHIAWITFPSGKQLAHLHCAFHRRQDVQSEANWISRASLATWVIVGADHEEHDHCAETFEKIQAEHLLLTDLIGDYRRAAGLPCALLTPLADKVIGNGRLVQLFATQVTHRFDNVALITNGTH